jgi:alpha-ketoglutarate-dependent taurine dioxygenase
MSKSTAELPKLASFGSVRRRAIDASGSGLVKRARLSAGDKALLVMEPAVDGVNLISWVERNREEIEARLLEEGGLLFRNFNLEGVGRFEQFIRVFAEDLLDYSYQSTPRSRVSNDIYTSTEYPAAHTIPLHNEMAYAHSWPMKIWFYCVTRAEQGGETPIADSRKVFARIEPQIREHFIRRKVMYVRNYDDEGLDLSWSTVFQTTNKSEVEAYCRRAGIEYEWLSRNRLRTRQVCQAALPHPRTGEWVWFNQAHLFHISNLEPEVRETLAAIYREEDYPRNAYYGDGSAIEEETLGHIREAYAREAIVFSWQTGDVLMLDNMLMAHGRRPFAGPRMVVVGMAQPAQRVEA